MDFPIDDSYYICITSDDGSKLFIEGSLVISNDGLHGAVQECVTYDTLGGVKQVDVEYFQRGGGATLRLEYVPLSRPDNFRLMRVIEPFEFVSKVRYWSMSFLVEKRIPISNIKCTPFSFIE